MKFSINRDVFRESLFRAAAAVDSRVSSDVLRHVTISATAGKICLRATDLDVGVTAIAKADVERRGSVMLPSGLLLDIINAAPSDIIVVATNGKGVVRISSRPAVFFVRGRNPNGLPQFAFTTDTARRFTIRDATLKRAIQLVDYATGDLRSTSFAGINFSLTPAMENPMLSVAASDGHRLAVATVAVECCDVVGPLSFTLPKRSIAAIVQALAGAGNIGVTSNEMGGMIYFAGDSVSLSSKAIGVAFPEYECIFRTNGCVSVTVDRRSFAAALLRVGISLDGRADDARYVRITRRRSGLELFVPMGQTSGAKEVVPANCDGDGEPVNIKLDYLLEPLSRLREKEVRIIFGGSRSPIYMASDDESFRYAAMPVVT